MARTRKAYTPEFKLAAVKMIADQTAARFTRDHRL